MYLKKGLPFLDSLFLCAGLAQAWLANCGGGDPLVRKKKCPFSNYVLKIS